MYLKDRKQVVIEYSSFNDYRRQIEKQKKIAESTGYNLQNIKRGLLDTWATLTFEKG